MGNFLEKPNTHHETDGIEGRGLVCALSGMQGWRRDMEDAHTCVVGLPNHEDCALFGVFDGHGGATTARRAAVEIVEVLSRTPGYRRARSAQQWSEVLYRGFLRLDHHLRRSFVRADGRKVSSAVDGSGGGESASRLPVPSERSGSTAVIAVITPRDILVANAGDSRCVLVRGGQVVAMSEDHKPERAAERRRIRRAGGSVSYGRVNGELAVSRALGDWEYKSRSDLGDDSQAVTAAPDVRSLPRHASDEFLILACDGVWDVLSSSDASGLVRQRVVGADVLGGRAVTSSELAVGSLPAMSRRRALTQVTSDLVQHCLDLGSRDNMTACVVAFPGAWAACAALSGAAPEKSSSPSPIDPSINSSGLVNDASALPSTSPRSQRSEPVLPPDESLGAKLGIASSTTNTTISSSASQQPPGPNYRSSRRANARRRPLQTPSATATPTPSNPSPSLNPPPSPSYAASVRSADHRTRRASEMPRPSRPSLSNRPASATATRTPPSARRSLNPNATSTTTTPRSQTPPAQKHKHRPTSQSTTPPPPTEPSEAPSIPSALLANDHDNDGISDRETPTDQNNFTGEDSKELVSGEGREGRGRETTQKTDQNVLLSGGGREGRGEETTQKTDQNVLLSGRGGGGGETTKKHHREAVPQIPPVVSKDGVFSGGTGHRPFSGGRHHLEAIDTTGVKVVDRSAPDSPGARARALASLVHPSSSPRRSGPAETHGRGGVGAGTSNTVDVRRPTRSPLLSQRVEEQAQDALLDHSPPEITDKPTATPTTRPSPDRSPTATANDHHPQNTFSDDHHPLNSRPPMDSSSSSDRLQRSHYHSHTADLSESLPPSSDSPADLPPRSSHSRLHVAGNSVLGSRDSMQSSPGEDGHRSGRAPIRTIASNSNLASARSETSTSSPSMSPSPIRRRIISNSNRLDTIGAMSPTGAETGEDTPTARAPMLGLSRPQVKGPAQSGRPIVVRMRAVSGDVGGLDVDGRYGTGLQRVLSTGAVSSSSRASSATSRPIAPAPHALRAAAAADILMDDIQPHPTSMPHAAPHHRPRGLDSLPLAASNAGRSIESAPSLPRAASSAIRNEFGLSALDRARQVLAAAGMPVPPSLSPRNTLTTTPSNDFPPPSSTSPTSSSPSSRFRHHPLSRRHHHIPLSRSAPSTPPDDALPSLRPPEQRFQIGDEPPPQNIYWGQPSSSRSTTEDRPPPGMERPDRVWPGESRTAQQQRRRKTRATRAERKARLITKAYSEKLDVVPPKRRK